MDSPDLGFINDIDWSNPDEVNDQGKRIFNVRCRVPFSAPTPGTAYRIARDKSAANERVIDDDGDGVRLDPDATGDTGSNDEFELGEPLVGGIASSTSVDFFGTEMSLGALNKMAAQMMAGEGASRGIPYLPRHNLGFSAVEWDMVIGRTVGAEVLSVESDQVAKPHSPAEAQFMLRVTVMLFKDEPLAQALLRRVSPPPTGRGETIGMSIGGWFTQLQVIQNDEGEVERVIVHGVDLDHLAVTRAPANPDADGIAALRSMIERSATSARAALMFGQLRSGHSIAVTRAIALEVRTMINADTEINERHIVASKETDNTVVFQYLKAGASPDDVEPDEMITNSQDDKPEDEESRSADDAGSDVADSGEDRAKDEDEDESSDERAFGEDDDDEDEDADRAVDDDDEDSEDDRSALDTTPSAAQNVTVNDAHRSALPTTPTPGTTGATSEEPAMSDQNVSLDAIRSLLDEKLAPVTDRLAALEGGDDRSTNQPEPTPVPEVDPNADLRAKLEEANLRAKRAEDAAAAMASRPFRVGRSTSPHAPASGPAAQSVYDGLVQRGREEAPVLAAVAERMIPLMTEEKGAKAVTRRDLLDGLSAMLNAAEADGIITDPSLRSHWK